MVFVFQRLQTLLHVYTSQQVHFLLFHMFQNNQMLPFLLHEQFFLELLHDQSEIFFLYNDNSLTLPALYFRWYEYFGYPRLDDLGVSLKFPFLHLIYFSFHIHLTYSILYFLLDLVILFINISSVIWYSDLIKVFSKML